ncbi:MULTISPECIES: hypothetical protein [unclassified Breznakia]|uniref:hypothetical protein n=1 Tax=unclassified Breznakia TaxID=2623764 RepID=UPI002405D689|nr:MULTISPECIES: hypothetical protein [unclassified Breznakia]MDF9838910.1 hypothetical protein [Breznakia sp. PFB2-8]MDF9860942.1 hypothetical protein [Breznakia sp. PH5-24]
MYAKQGYILIEAILLFYMCTMIVLMLSSLCVEMGNTKKREYETSEIKYETEIQNIYESYQDE